MSATAPTHLLMHGGDAYTLCGVRVASKDALPFVLARYAPAHTRGHPDSFTVCAVCAEVARRTEGVP